MLKIVENNESQSENRTNLDALARAGAQQMLQTALEVEVAEYLGRHASERDEAGHAKVVRNGHGPVRKVMCGAGTLEVKRPRVNDKRKGENGKRKRFTSSILPPYMRRSPKVSEVLPVLYLRGLSTGDFAPALEELLGPESSGLSSTNIARMTASWEAEYRAFSQRRFDHDDFVYVWVDGIHFNIRLEDDRLCTLVMIGAKVDGTKELIAITDGFRESTDSWSEVLRDLKERGLQPPEVAVGDGALGFWAAMRDVWPQTQVQRDWCHKIANVVDKFPKSLQPKIKAKLRDIMYAETKEAAEEGMDAFARDYGVKYERGTKCLLKDREALLTHFDFPAEHWKHLRTTNPIESSFATVRLRQRVTKGAGSRTKALTMAFKLLDMAQQRWRKISAPHLLPLVRGGILFVDGIQKTSTQNNSENAA